MNKIKNWLKKNSFILSLYELIFQRPIINVFNKANSKKALLSYSTYHFKKNDYKAHSNYQESVAVAEIMDSLGFNVDVVNNNRETKLSLNQYDVIIGEGIPLYQSLVNNIVECFLFFDFVFLTYFGFSLPVIPLIHSFTSTHPLPPQSPDCCTYL